MLQRGSSPRILSAYVLGSGGRTLTSGAELAARLGPGHTWAYFSVKRARASWPSPTAAARPAGERIAHDEPSHGPRRPGGRRARTGGSAGIDPRGRRGRGVAALGGRPQSRKVVRLARIYDMRPPPAHLEPGYS